MSENRLGRETSPYLLQHRDNPVHWWAWGPDALAEARRSGKPILLSVGYAACHWCHVMAHESFEDEPTARVMNDLFVNIKVDREERPDIDAIYMSALHHLGEQGGWPLTMFLDSDAKPFWGGTYFPKEARFGKPAFVTLLREVSRIYHGEPDKIRTNAQALTEALVADSDGPQGRPQIGDAVLEDLTTRMVGAVDTTRGGLRGAPKFPQWSFFWLLWRGGIRFDLPASRAAVETTLANICQGGIYDHLGGGFARYSVDDRWLVPHFEKMLYDNALLIDLMTDVWRETRNPLFKARIEETVGWLQREMIAEGGGFAASLDADSEGEEGRFYVWTAAEIADVLGPDDARLFALVYDVTRDGNWEGHTILNRLANLKLGSDAEEAKLKELRARLLARRTTRVRPGWDDKVLADWNGLMIAALARASSVFDRPEWLALAERAFAFVKTSMTVDGRLMHAARAGQLKAPSTASDYANMIWAALRLHETTGHARYLAAAERWTAILDRHYWSDSRGGYHISADDTPDVIVRLRTAHDDAAPNANGIMISNLVALYLLTGKSDYVGRAEAIPTAFTADLARNMISHCGLVSGIFDLNAPQQVAIVGRDAGTLGDALRSLAMPGALELIVSDSSQLDAAPLLKGKTDIDGQATAYVCVGPQCSLPVTLPDTFTHVLREKRLAPSGP
jgi:uncharacterized protein YyaL (SSP411 family)